MARPRRHGGPLRCRCGESTFSARVRRDEEVGLLTCARGHHSLLLDSRDHWASVIQSGRPRQTTCRCRSREFTVSVAYELRATTGDVRTVDVVATCVRCGVERRWVEVGIDYGPTTQLVDRPLDPIEDPWLKARWVELTGFWTDDDIHAVLDHVVRAQGGVLLFAPGSEPATTAGVSAVLDAARGRRGYDLWVAPTVVDIPTAARDVWKRWPVVATPSPLRIHLPTGDGRLQDVKFAEEILERGVIAPQPEPFVRFARDLVAWMRTRFTSLRSPRAVDNPEELARLDLA